MTWAIGVLTTIFWAVLAATVVWVAVSTREANLAAASFGEGGSRLVTTVLLGVLAGSSGVLLLYHRRSGDEEYWTGWELVYALALFVSLFYGVYSFFGWFFY